MGSDAYEPSTWVLEVVGKRYLYHDESNGGPRVCECFGYDPRNGFWMQTIDDGKFKQMNISERAIGATFHRVQMKLGAWALLEMLVQLGRMPTPEENEQSTFRPNLPMALATLFHNGIVTKDAQLTDRGRGVVGRIDVLRDHIYLD